MLVLRFIILSAIFSVTTHAAAVIRPHPTLDGLASEQSDVQASPSHMHSRLVVAKGLSDPSKGLHRYLVKKADELSEPLADLDKVVDTVSVDAYGPLSGINNSLYETKPASNLTGGAGSVVADVGDSVKEGADKGVAGAAEGTISNVA